MSEINSFAIMDGAATPVSHTFSFSKEENGVLHYVDRSGGIPAGYPRLTVSLKEPANPNGNWKARYDVRVPVLEVTSPSTMTGIQPAPTVAYEMIARHEYILPGRSSTQNRKDLWAYGTNGLAAVGIKAQIVDLDSVFH